MIAAVNGPVLVDDDEGTHALLHDLFWQREAVRQRAWSRR